MDGKGIDDAIKRSADIQLPKNIFRCRVRALRLIRLSFHARDFGLRIPIFLLLLHQLEVCFRGGELIFRLFHLAGRSRALLLQTLQGFQVALRGVTLIAGFYQLSFEGQDFFAIAAAPLSADFSLRSSYLGQRARRLAAGVGIVQLRQELAPFFT